MINLSDQLLIRRFLRFFYLCTQFFRRSPWFLICFALLFFNNTIIYDYPEIKICQSSQIFISICFPRAFAYFSNTTSVGTLPPLSNRAIFDGFIPVISAISCCVIFCQVFFHGLLHLLISLSHRRYFFYVILSFMISFCKIFCISFTDLLNLVPDVWPQCVYPSWFRAVIGLRLVMQSYPHERPYIWFLFVRPEICPWLVCSHIRLPSDSPHEDTLAFGYILPTAGRIRDLHPLETCAARRT